MCIEKDEMPDRQARVLARKRFINDLPTMVVRGYFYVGIYKYARPGSISDWIVVFKVARSKIYEIQGIIEARSSADKHDPIFLSSQEPYDYVASIRSQSGVNKKLAAGIIQVMMPDGTHPTYSDTTGSENMLYRNIKFLITQGNNFNDGDELILISYTRQFNICGNNKTIDFYM